MFWALRGSVVPIFINQLKEGLNLTVTNTYMTRFVMKKEETFNLILKSLEISKGGETFILKMDSIKIGTTDPRRGGSWLNKIPLLSNQAPLFYHLL
ncbi:polysaccharide biosynthesis protein [Candidatus Acidulodesulfobacterium sp. H_13]|uniref:polysaccharide biosynthesis protein n=1 Tax=Candidatus Acidulodesulfobacterium sp. H_13 TaxID=3395470 RepID=UPI003AF42F8D